MFMHRLSVHIPTSILFNITLPWKTEQVFLYGLKVEIAYWAAAGATW